MSAIFNAVKATSLPQSPAPHTLYYIKGGSDIRVKGYVSDANGTVFPLGIIDEQDVLSVQLNGFTVGSDTAINSNNSIFTAFRNIQGQINTLSSAVAGGIKIPLPLDASNNPNYPQAQAGDSYLVTVAGRIGGASGPLVQVGDKIVAQQNNAGGNQATVGSAWFIVQGNIDLATAAVSGITRIATDVEVNAGSENFAYVTPATLRGGVRNTILTGFTVGSDSAVAATDNVLQAFGKIQGQINAKYSSPSGTTLQYIRGNGSLATLNTEVVPESGTALYFTAERVRTVLLDGLGEGTNEPITASDSILQAFAKVQNQISNSVTEVDLNYIAGTNQGTIANSAGEDAVIPLANNSNAGLMSGLQKTKLDSLNPNAYSFRATWPNAKPNTVTHGNDLDLEENPTYFASRGTSFDQKKRLTLDLPGLHEIVSVMTVSQNNDNQGGKHQVGFNDDLGMFYRYGGTPTQQIVNDFQTRVNNDSGTFVIEPEDFIENLSQFLESSWNQWAKIYTEANLDPLKLSSKLLNYNIGTNDPITDQDSILGAFGKIQAQVNGKEAAFSKNTAFNKNFGTASGTVAEGNDSRINNGQTAFSWGNHAGLYALASHTHTIANVTGLQTALDGKANTSHTHTIANVTGLQTALDGKEAAFSKNSAFNKNFGTASGTVAEGNDSRINNGQTAFSWGNHAGLYALLSHSHSISDVTGLQTALNGKEAAFSKNTAFNKNFGTTTGSVAEGNDSRINNGQTAFSWGNHAGLYALASHTHTIANVTGLQTALDGKANTSHTHTINQITGLNSKRLLGRHSTTTGVSEQISLANNLTISDAGELAVVWSQTQW